MIVGIPPRIDGRPGWPAILRCRSLRSHWNRGFPASLPLSLMRGCNIPWPKSFRTVVMKSQVSGACSRIRRHRCSTRTTCRAVVYGRIRDVRGGCVLYVGESVLRTSKIFGRISVVAGVRALRLSRCKRSLNPRSTNWRHPRCGNWGLSPLFQQRFTERWIA